MMEESTQSYAKVAASTAREADGEWQIDRANALFSVVVFGLFSLYTNSIRRNAF